MTTYDQRAGLELVGTVRVPWLRAGDRVRQPLPEGVTDPSEWDVAARLMALAPQLDWTVEHG